jgi:hypothetical protein
MFGAEGRAAEFKTRDRKSWHDIVANQSAADISTTRGSMALA